jgi:large subunit ribosomal protein L6
MEKEIAKTIKLPDGAEAEIKGQEVTIKANGKENIRLFKNHGVEIIKKDEHITIIGKPANKKVRAVVMAITAHIKNMILGLKFGYDFEMKISYSHFPMTAKVEGKEVIISNFLGEKFPRRAKIIGETTVEAKGENINVKGYKLEEIGQTVANIQQVTRVIGRDIRRFTDGIYLAERKTIEEIPEGFEIEIIRGKV